MLENSNYLNNLSWKFSKSKTPYPFISIDNFLSQDVYKKIKEKFPSLDKFEYFGNIYQNNIGIRIAFSEFTNNLDPFWNEFGGYFLRDNFFYSFCDFYKDDIKYYYPKIYNQLKKRNFKIGISGIDSFDNYDVLLDFHLGINTPVTKMTSVRGPHLDNAKSLYTALCYLKDTDDSTDSGHFTIYDLKPFKLLKLDPGRAINLSNVKKYTEIKYKSNNVATFLNTNKSIHGVTQREITTKIRKYFLFNAVFKEGIYKIPLASRIANRINKFF